LDGGPDHGTKPDPADRVALGAIEAALAIARQVGEDRPALEIVASSLADMGVRTPSRTRSLHLLARDREAWLLRLRSAERSASSISAYRQAIDDLLSWAQRKQRTGDLFEERAIVDYLDEYRERRKPAPATYQRRFLLLRRFMSWVSHRNGLPDPFLDLQAPPKPRGESDWLTREEFAQLLDGAEHPARRRPGLAERDRLVLLTLAMTGLRSELISLDWGDVTLDGPRPSLLVRCGKGGRSRRQPLPAQLAAELERWRARRGASGSDPVFCGLGGARLQHRSCPDRPPCGGASRDLKARHRAHAAPHRRDMAAPGNGRHPPRRRVPRSRRPLDREPLRTRRWRGAARRRRGARRRSRRAQLPSAAPRSSGASRSQEQLHPGQLAVWE
jgi:site-specific recombinase XerC